MKYWSYFAAKLAAAAGILWAGWKALNFLLPPPESFLRHKVSRFPQDLQWTGAILGLWLLGVGLVFLILWDQRQRCRTCLRRLMMPVNRGNWSKAALFSPPEVERICPYGHGTLAEPDVHLTAAPTTSWKEHEDIWKELEQIEDRKP